MERGGVQFIWIYGQEEVHGIDVATSSKDRHHRPIKVTQRAGGRALALGEGREWESKHKNFENGGLAKKTADPAQILTKFLYLRDPPKF